VSKEPQLGTCNAMGEPHFRDNTCTNWTPSPLPTDRATEPADSPTPPPLEGEGPNDDEETFGPDDDGMIPLPFSDGERRSMKEAFQREYDARVAADATIDTLSAELAATREERDKEAEAREVAEHCLYECVVSGDLTDEAEDIANRYQDKLVAALDASRKEN
jgi:hypothetical protein